MPTQRITIEQLNDDVWVATQKRVDVVGEGGNPGRAVEDYARKIAEEHYES